MSVYFLPRRLSNINASIISMVDPLMSPSSFVGLSSAFGSFSVKLNLFLSALKGAENFLENLIFSILLNVISNCDVHTAREPFSRSPHSATACTSNQAHRRTSSFLQLCLNIYHNIYQTHSLVFFLSIRVI